VRDVGRQVEHVTGFKRRVVARREVPQDLQRRIGRIDVQVVTPQPAPAPAPIARPGRGARPTPAAPEATPASYLTFGLRQT